MYLDHETGQLVINLASSDPKQLDALQEELRASGLFPRGLEDQVVVREVSHSMAELEAAREILRQGYGTNAVQGTAFLERENRLWITLDNSERQKDIDKALDPVLRDVPADIPVSVSFGLSGGESACNTRRYCGGGSTRRAGIGIRLADTTTVCTTGFAFKRSNGDEFLTTAGHCFYDTDSGTIRTWNGTHDGGKLGGLWIGTLNNVNPYKYPVNDYMNCDCRLIQVSDSLTQNVLYKDDSVKWRTVTVKHLQSTTGDLVKMFGAGTNGLASAGVVTETSADVDGRNWASCQCWFLESTLANYVHTNGDSGGAVTRNSVNRAVGIHSGDNNWEDSQGQTVWRRRYFDVGLMEQPWNLNGEVMITN